MLLAGSSCNSGKRAETGAHTASANTGIDSAKAETKNSEAVNHDRNARAPATVRDVKVRSGKPPSLIYEIRIDFQNERPAPVWLVIRYFLDKPLNDSAKFMGNDLLPRQFGATEYLDGLNKRSAVVIDFYGEDSFRALRLPGNGTAKFAQLQLSAWSEASDFEVWEANKILVNGRTPLEEWLPYKTMSDQDTVSLTDRHTANTKSLDWDSGSKDYVKYPNEKVEFVTMEVIDKWKLPLKLTRD
jgi:hypothetical protein